MSEETYDEILARLNASPCGGMVQVPDWFFKRITRQVQEPTLESVSGLRHRLIHILRRAAAGETFVITVRGRPIARVCPLREDVNTNTVGEK